MDGSPIMGVMRYCFLDSIFSFSPDQDGKGGNVGDDAENKYYPEYEAEISKIILLGDFDSDDNLGKLRQKKTPGGVI